ncbi:ribosomal RNA-processing protein 7 homolog A [Colletes latitarsis]|uniref:ribosomal RNA-processing protein 7 homolog A n=1 Tax=Colletes latitarsis TaxID=2605962 RepID=UPI00403511C4
MKNDKQNCRGFKSLWIRFDKENTDEHQLYFKEHSIRKQDPRHSRKRTLFVLNIPPYVTTNVLTSVFSELCGTVSNLYFTNSKGFKAAYIVFEKESALEKALELAANCIITLNNKDNICLTGLAKWCKEYNDSIYNEDKMRKEIEDYMCNYDKEIANNTANAKLVEEEAKDNDGWVTVSGRKKRRQFPLSRKECTTNKIQRKEEQKNKKKELLNFYTFQIRESKKQNLAELRKKFELDKKRLQDLKSKRTFKPF